MRVVLLRLENRTWLGLDPMKQFIRWKPLFFCVDCALPSLKKGVFFITG